MPARLTLIRGLPGSGKSTLAKQLVQGLGGVHYEADQYFIDPITGEYEFDINRLIDAHDTCQDMTICALKAGSHVIVSNTFTTLREMHVYFDMAAEYGVSPNVILCQMNFGSIHGIPHQTFMRMKKRFQYDIAPLLSWHKKALGASMSSMGEPIPPQT